MQIFVLILKMTLVGICELDYRKRMNGKLVEAFRSFPKLYIFLLLFVQKGQITVIHKGVAIQGRISGIDKERMNYPLGKLLQVYL